jgi:MOSC domain-containing protein YiiM
MTRIDFVLAGAIEPLGPDGVPSGIGKRPMAGRVEIGVNGLSGDAQGDLKVHGGPEKAVHHYAFEHYARWAELIGENLRLNEVGAFGENLSSVGLTERDVAVGDTFRLGTSVLQVSQGRQPCWKLNVRFGVPDMAVQVQKTGMTGWYYRVLEPGTIEAGDELVLVDRLAPEWTLERLWRTLYIDTMNLDELAAMATLPFLPEKWRSYAQRRLATHKVEDWSKRLHGKTK